MKKCLFCAEEIQDEAVKCRYCGEYLDRGAKPRTKWYHSTSVVVLGLLCLGPLALPLLWLHPRYKIVTKVVATIVIIAFTVLLCYLAVCIYAWLMEQLSELGI